MIRETETLKQKIHLMQISPAGLIGIREGRVVLEVGCGQGTFTSCTAKLPKIIVEK